MSTLAISRLLISSDAPARHAITLTVAKPRRTKTLLDRGQALAITSGNARNISLRITFNFPFSTFTFSNSVINSSSSFRFQISEFQFRFQIPIPFPLLSSLPHNRPNQSRHNVVRSIADIPETLGRTRYALHYIVFHTIPTLFLVILKQGLDYILRDKTLNILRR